MPAATIGAIASVGLPFPQLGLVIAVFVELAGGIALILGYRTRLAAAMLAAYCIATAVLFHSNVADQNELVHFLKNIAMTGGLLQVVAFGAGRFGLDARARRRDDADPRTLLCVRLRRGARLRDRTEKFSNCLCSLSIAKPAYRIS